MKTLTTYRYYLYRVDNVVGGTTRRCVGWTDYDRPQKSPAVQLHYGTAIEGCAVQIERRVIRRYEPSRKTDLTAADLRRMGYSCHHVGCRRGYCRVADEGGVSTYHGIYGDGYTVRLGRHNGSTQYEDIAYYTREGRGDLGSYIEAK